jgi:tetratricopeptide (TPR) repeat protein
MTKTIKELQTELENQVLVHGALHESVAALHSDIGTMYFNAEDYTKALSCYELALEIATETLGEDHEFVVDTHYRIGRVMDARAATEEKLAESKAHMKENLRMREYIDGQKRGSAATSTASGKTGTGDVPRKLSLDDMDSTLIYHDMAEQARLEGDLDKALPLYIKSIELRRKKFGASSPALSPVLLNYAELLRQKGNNETAKAVLSEALTININTYGKTHRSTAEVMNSLGLVCRLLGELDRAEQALLEALKIRRGIFGDFDLTVGASLNNLAELYREKQQYQEAITYHNLAITAFQTAGGEDHPGEYTLPYLYPHASPLTSSLKCMFVQRSRF